MYKKKIPHLRDVHCKSVYTYISHVKHHLKLDLDDVRRNDYRRLAQPGERPAHKAPRHPGVSPPGLQVLLHRRRRRPALPVTTSNLTDLPNLSGISVVDKAIRGQRLRHTIFGARTKRAFVCENLCTIILLFMLRRCIYIYINMCIIKRSQYVQRYCCDY